jgi:hypothetical protein
MKCQRAFVKTGAVGSDDEQLTEVMVRTRRGSSTFAPAASVITRRSFKTYERTNLSRLSQWGFLGLKVMNLLNRTWATGAMPIGAPGWPEFALKVAST